MAFSEAQRFQIRHYLGYPDVYQFVHPRLESAMDVVGGRTDASAEVVSILAEVTAARLALRPTSSTGTHTRDGIKQADEVHFFGDANSGNVASDAMRKTGRTWVSELSIIFGVPVINDIFRAGGYSGDGWAAHGGSPGTFPVRLG